ncbi:hypothetical protein F2P79_009543 [Pimephales promelas]|nr:hypothetical protein F2P79_009543 [Pimephales promelas]
MKREGGIAPVIASGHSTPTTRKLEQRRQRHCLLIHSKQDDERSQSPCGASAGFKNIGKTSAVTCVCVCVQRLKLPHLKITWEFSDTEKQRGLLDTSFHWHELCSIILTEELIGLRGTLENLYTAHLQAAHPSTGLLGKSSQSILGLGLPRFYEGTVPLCALQVLTSSLCPASCAKPWHLEFFGIEQTPYGWIDPGVGSRLVVTQEGDCGLAPRCFIMGLAGLSLVRADV